MNFPDNYAAQLQRFNQGTEAQRIRCVDQWLTRETGDREARNRRLYDAYHVLRGTWNKESAFQWRFNELQQIDLADVGQLGRNADAVVSKLRERVDEARARTARDFDTLWQQPVPESPLDYLEWVYENLPFLTLDLPEDFEAAKHTYQKRVAKLTAPLATQPIYRDNIRTQAQRRFLAWRKQHGLL